MTLATTLIIIGRVIFGGFFLIAGIRNFIHFAGRCDLATNFGWKLPPALGKVKKAPGLATSPVMVAPPSVVIVPTVFGPSSL